MTGRRPAYVTVLWVAPPLRELHPEMPLSLEEAVAQSRAEPEAQVQTEAGAPIGFVAEPEAGAEIGLMAEPEAEAEIEAEI